MIRREDSMFNTDTVVYSIRHSQKTSQTLVYSHHDTIRGWGHTTYRLQQSTESFRVRNILSDNYVHFLAFTDIFNAVETTIHVHYFYKALKPFRSNNATRILFKQ